MESGRDGKVRGLAVPLGQLLQEIRLRRAELERLVASGLSLTDHRVLRLSRDIDRLVLRYHQERLALFSGSAVNPQDEHQVK